MKEKENIIGVLTGDLVKSGKLQSGEIIEVIGFLKKTFEALNKHFFKDRAKFEIYRGDSFQAILPYPEKSLLAAMIIRAGLRSIILRNRIKNKSVNYAYTDARIAIGVGYVSYMSNNVVESQGEAFVKSGQLLDKLHKEHERIGIETVWDYLNEEFYVESKLADAIINRWTPFTAEAVYYYLLQNKTQAQLAKILKISQPAVHKRLVIQGNIKSIKVFIERFTELIKIQD